MGKQMGKKPHYRLAKQMWVVLLGMCCLLAGCKGKGEAGNDAAAGETASEVLWSSQLTSQTYGKEGSFYSEHNRVHFLDAATGESAIICDEVACDHESRDCAAYFDGICYATLEGDHLLMVTSHDSNLLWEYSVFETEVNGTNRKKLGDFGIMQSVYQVLFTEDNIIASYYNSVDENLEPMDESRAGIMVYDRKTNTSRVLWEKQAFNAIAGDIQYHEGKVYFSVFYYDVTMEELEQYGEQRELLDDRTCFELYSLDLEDGSSVLIQDGDWETFDICQGRIWYDFEGSLWSYEIATGKKQKEQDRNFRVMQCYVPDKLVLRDRENSGDYYTYAPGGDYRKLGTKKDVLVSVVYPDITWAMNYNTPTGNGEVVFWNTEEFLAGGEVWSEK